MPKANGKHYPYTRRFGGDTYRSDGRTFTKSEADKSAERSRKAGAWARVVKLGKTNRYAIYKSNKGSWIPSRPGQKGYKTRKNKYGATRYR